MAEAQSKSDETRLHIATKQADTQLKTAIVVSLAFLARDLVPQLLGGLGRMFRGERAGWHALVLLGKGRVRLVYSSYRAGCAALPTYIL
jgi:hypothetical protein